MWIRTRTATAGFAALLACMTAVATTVAAAPAATAPVEKDVAPRVIHQGSVSLADHTAFRQPWHITLSREDALAAWQRLVEVKIPGVALDQRFKLKGQELFVSPKGDDTADGSEKGKPWKTLAFAISKLKPGMIVYLEAGTYYGPVAIRGFNGTAEMPGAIRGVPGDEVIIAYPPEYIAARKAELGDRPAGKTEGAFDKAGKEAHYPALITIYSGTYLEISGLHFVGAREYLPHNLYWEDGIAFTGGKYDGCRMLYNEIEGVGHCGIKSGSDCLFEGNYIHDFGFTFHDHGFYQGSNNVTIRKNLEMNAAGWGVHAYTTPEHMVISHNILAGNAWHGIIIGGTNDVAMHNILYRNNRGGVFLFREKCKDNMVTNNIFVEPNGAIGYDGTPTGNTVDYNLLAPGTSLRKPVSGDTFGPHNVTGDPKFVDAEKLDFRLKPGSPCIGAGDKTWGTYFGTAPDIGLYQSGGGEVQGGLP